PMELLNGWFRHYERLINHNTIRSAYVRRLGGVVTGFLEPVDPKAGKWESSDIGFVTQIQKLADRWIDHPLGFYNPEHVEKIEFDPSMIEVVIYLDNGSTLYGMEDVAISIKRLFGIT